jgi:hypothetical protein
LAITFIHASHDKWYPIWDDVMLSYCYYVITGCEREGVWVGGAPWTPN